MQTPLAPFGAAPEFAVQRKSANCLKLVPRKATIHNGHMLTTRTKIALAGSIQRIVTAWPRLVGRSLDVVSRRSGIRWALDLNEGIDFSIWLLGAFERRTVAAYSSIIKPGMTVLDIGANVGAHTLFFARLVGPGGKVVAVEPTAWASGRLRANLQLNSELEKVVLVRQAMLVGSSGESLPDTIYASWPLDGHNVHPKLRAQAKATSGAKAITLDQLISEETIGRVDFIKLDVDGHEAAVLRGGLGVLRRDTPDIIFELSPHSLAEAGESATQMLQQLHDLGYRFYDLNLRTLPMAPNDLVASITDGGGINIIARPTR